MSDSTPIPDWLLERMAIGELPVGHARADLERRLAADSDSAARLKQLEAENQAILAQHRPAQAAAEIERRLHLARTIAADKAADKRQRRRVGILSILGTAAAAAAALALVATGPGNPLTPSGPEGEDPVMATGPEVTRPKGDASLRVYRKRGDEVETLSRAATVRAGDLLQISYIASGQGYGMVFSIDGAGAVTLHYPQSTSGSTVLEEDGPVGLAHAYELDDAPEFERFFFITAPKDASAHLPIDIEQVLDHASELAQAPAERARTAMLPLPTSLSQWSLVLNKATAQETSHEK